jgi:hypothetical protein
VSDELDVLKLVAARLEAVGISYMITGSMAANFYTTPRMTRDIDLVIELSERDVQRVTDLFQDEYYIDRDMVQRAVQSQSMFNMIHNALVVKVDCVVRKDSEYRREEFARRRPVTVAGQPVYIVAPEDLILSKLDWAKESDWTGSRHCLSESLGGAIRTHSALPGGPTVNDTPREIDERYRAMLMQRSGEERLIMGCAMRETARALVEASILEQDPHATVEALHTGVFLRFYGHEFNAATRDTILAAIEQASRSAVSRNSDF